MWPRFARRRSLLGGLCLVLGSGIGCGKAASTAPDDPPGPSGQVEADDDPLNAGFADLPAVELGDGAWLGSFETGLDADEQLWLLSTAGEPVSVMDPEMPANDTIGRGTAGYLDEWGQISETLFDLAHERLLVTSLEESARVTRALDLRTGRWSALPSSALRSTSHGPVLLALEDDVLSVLAAGDEPAFETAARVEFDPERMFLSSVEVQRYVVMGTERLLVVHDDGSSVRALAELERAEDAWERATPLTSTGAGTAFIGMFGSGLRACVVGVDGSASIIEKLANVRGRAQVRAPFPVERCSFSPDGSRVAFSGRLGLSELMVTDLGGLVLAEFEGLYLQANLGDFAYGTNGNELVRFNWMNFALETLPSPTWCVDEDGRSNVGAHLVSIVGASALVEAACRTIDSRYSGVYLLSNDDGASPRVLLEPQGWDILQIGALPDGSALIAQLPADAGSLPDGGDRFLRVTPDGSVQELGPFSDMPVPLHAPVGNVAP